MDNNKNYNQLLQDCKSYLKTRYDLLRLELLEKLSRILALIVLILVCLIIVFGALAFFSVALVGWMANWMSISLACCILGGILMLITLIIYLLREKIFVNPFIKMLSGLIFSDKAETSETDNTQSQDNDGNRSTTNK